MAFSEYSEYDMWTLWLFNLFAGYGPGEDASLNVRDFLRKIVNEGIEINGLDRWHVQVNPYR